MYTVFKGPLFCHYKANVLSKASAFHLIVTLLTLIPPLLVAYRSRGFWQRQDVYREQPETHFKHELMVVLETEDPAQPIAWSTYPELNKIMTDSYRAPRVKTFENDWNRDGLRDELEFELTMPLNPDENIVGVKAMLFFDVQLHRFSEVNFEGLVYLAEAFGLPVSKLDVIGDLSLVQRELLAHKGRDDRFKRPLVQQGEYSAEAYNFATILEGYSGRNYTTKLTNQYTSWQRGSSPAFELKLLIRYPEQTIHYRPGFWQTMKWAWIQYLSVLVVFIVVFRSIKTYVFSKQVLFTQCVYPQLKN